MKCISLFEYSPSYVKLYKSQGNSIIKRETSTKVSHALVKIPPTENKKRPQKRCFICWTRYHKRKDVRTHCAGCEKKPGLCGEEHWRKFHSKKH